MEGVNNYGWDSATHPNSCNYLGEEILSILDDYKPQHILDLGCGNGALCNLMKERFPESTIVGVDYDRQGVELASKSYPAVSFYPFGVQDDPQGLLSETNVLFDVVVSTEVVEHLYAPGFLPKFSNEVLKKNGKLIITTPYHGYLKNLVLSLLNKWDSHHTALWDGGHIKFWSKKTLTKLLNDNGFDVLEFKGVGRFSYLWKSMVLICQKSD